METIKKILKTVFFLCLVGIIFYTSCSYFEKLTFTIRMNWFNTNIYPLVSFLKETLTLLVYIGYLIILYFYFYKKNKYKEEKQWLNILEITFRLLSFVVILYSLYVIGYDLKLIADKEKDILFGLPFIVIGGAVLFRFLAINFKKYITTNFKIEKGIIRGSIILILIGLIINIFIIGNA